MVRGLILSNVATSAVVSRGVSPDRTESVGEIEAGITRFLGMEAFRTGAAYRVRAGNYAKFTHDSHSFRTLLHFVHRGTYPGRRSTSSFECPICPLPSR